jgi:hypothetical protein
VAVVAADHGVGGDGGVEIVMVFPCEVERGWHGLGDVAGGAEALADDVRVRLGAPFLRFGAGDPVTGFFLDGFPEGEAFVDAENEAGEGIGSAEDVCVSVSEADVFLHGSAELGEVEVLQDKAEGGDLGEAADMLIVDGAFAGVFSLGVFGEKAAVVFF